ncbi:DUF2537 domain-containing protein [Kibdelosporangium lantanae]
MTGERAVLVGPDEQAIDPFRLAIPADLATALQEWAHVVAAMQRADAPEDPTSAVLVSRRGRQLADRLAGVLRTTVRYLDPLTGETLLVDSAPTAAAEPVPIRRPAEPTPWGTGITVSVMVALVTVAAVLTLAVTLSETGWVLALGANIVVTAGLAPSVWLARRVVVWRWVALGVASGLALGWIGLIFVLL